MTFPLILRRLRHILFFSAMLTFLCLVMFGEIAENTGYKYYRNYSYLEYDHHPQNWCIVQDQKGVIYVGNAMGILIYDGVTWDLLEIPNGTVRSMAIGADGHIFIGGNNEFGYLAPDSKGFLEYHSLRKHFDEQYGKFSDVWEIAATDDGVYFRTRRLLFRWNYKRIDFYQEGRYGPLYLCNGRLLIQQAKKGLQVVDRKNGTLSLLPGTQSLGRWRVWMLASYNAGPGFPGFLVGTNSSGLLVYRNGTLTSWPTEAADYIQKNKISHGIRLSNGHYAIATQKGGIIVIDAEGRVKYIFNRKRGLQNNDVNSVMEDNLGNIWLALARGVSRLEYRSPFYHYDYSSGLEGVVMTAAQHKNILYAGTTQGVFRLSVDAESFTPVPGLDDCWDLLSTGDSLLAATRNGVYRLDTDDGLPQKIYSGVPTFALNASGEFPGTVWCGSQKGLLALNRDNGRWRIAYKYGELKENIRYIVEEPDGTLWLITPAGKIIRATLSNGIEAPIFTHYKREKIPGEGNIYNALVNGRVVFATVKGLFRYNEANDTFVPDLLLGEAFAYNKENTDVRPVYRIAQDVSGNTWFHSGSRNYRAFPGSGGDVTIEGGPFMRLPLVQANRIIPDAKSGNIWFPGFEGLMRYDSANTLKWKNDFPTVIHKVFVNEDDPVVGPYNDNVNSTSIHEYPFNQRNFSFQCGALFFEKESDTQFRYKLDGYDDDWSQWTSETRKQYTNLDSGRYTFHVQAKNVYSVTGKEDTFSFRLHPPWYKAWWAFLLYSIGFLLFIFLVVEWRSRQLAHEKEKLEQVVEQRTLQLKEQSERLKEMDKIKSQFFANISHEFRTPLTLIMSPLEQLLAHSPDRFQKKSYRLMMRNARQLLTWINRLLELAHIDSGRIKLQAACLDMADFLKQTVAAFQGVAQQKNVTMEFLCHEAEFPLFFDLEKMEEVIYNLLSNAIKFTPPGGRITISLTKETVDPLKSFALIAVKDTGIGIPQKQLPYIFDRFFKIGAGGGTGIGLALTREIVLLHHGDIKVQSKEQDGTEFIVRLLLGKDHLSAEEIVDAQAPNMSGIKPQLSIDSDDESEEKSNGLLHEDRKIPGKEDESVEDEQSVEPDKLSILVVEDHGDMRRHIRSILESQYRVFEAKNGRQGVLKAEEFMPDLVICDVMMPDIDGFQVCRTLKKEIKTSHIPIILLTARASGDSMVRGLEAGADDYITKPFNEKMLIVRIKNLIDLRRQMQLKIQREKMLLPSQIAVSNQDDLFLKKFQEIIEENLVDEDFNVDVLCNRLSIARATLFRKIRVLTGETPNEFIRSYRLERAAQLLRENYGNVTEIAMAVGFSSSQYFSKCFKEKFHCSPKVFQASAMETT